ncbi:hypothetical protein PRZ48_007149 [Zasmidium cellare]|uniref:Uncharacterized protein n=1 Tax=Zasmidium cellare TaxID=395010 RepID=A0ABR0EJC8_ZASCE|nr:hypothetical protein PRZ48_007149 [Zasmidium cellare]
MPMQWDAAADQKLFAAVVRVFDVKLGNGVGEKLAKFMGPECNAKSIANHFTVIRKRANEMHEDGTEGGGATPAKKTKAKTGGRKGKKAASEGEDDEDESPPAKKQKKAKGEDGIEVGEDIGQGLRKESKVKAEVEEDEDDEV